VRVDRDLSCGWHGAKHRRNGAQNGSNQQRSFQGNALGDFGDSPLLPDYQ
jgi:hypothetical protein